MARTDTPSPTEATPEPGVGRSRWEQVAAGSWKTIALGAGAGAVTAGVTVVITLTATHNSARFYNAKAYANGLSDAMALLADGVDPFGGYDPEETLALFDR